MKQTGTKNILLIDDNISFLNSMQIALKKKHLDCQIAHNIQMAEDIIGRMNFDIIICDYFMPDSDGMTVLKEFRNIKQESILILTSNYPLDIEFKKSDRFQFIDKVTLLDWILEKYSKAEYV